MTKRAILPTILIISFCGILIYIVSSFHKAALPKNIKSVSAGIVSFEDFDFSEYSDGGAHKKFTIQGKKLGAGNKQFGLFKIAPIKVTEIKDASMTFYENGEPISHIMAKKAFLNASFNDSNSITSLINEIDFSGRVDVVTGDKRTLVCNTLKWNKARNRILAGGNCVLRFNSNIIRADYIDSDLKLKDFSSRDDKLKRLRALSRAVI